MNVAVMEDFDRPNLDEIPLHALSHSSRYVLCNLLNSIKLIPSDDGYLRDWRGLSELAEVSSAVPRNSNNPTDTVLREWEQSQNRDNPASLGKLLSFLGQIDRWDVHDDLKEKFEKDARDFVDRENRPSLISVSELEILTDDDVNRNNQGLPLRNYDAFFLHAYEDTDFANSIVSTLEDNFKLRICLRDRDLLPVRFEHDAIMRLIANRCARIVVLLSEHFLRSEPHKFLFKYAEALSIEQRIQKIVPCARNVRNLDVPNEYKFYVVLDYSRTTNFCDRLKTSIIRPVTPALQAPPVRISVSADTSEHRCIIEEISSEAQRKISISPSTSEVHTQVVQVPDPSAFLSPEESKADFKVSTEGNLAVEDRSTASKPRSPVSKLRKIFSSKNSSSEPTTNGNGEVKSKKKWGLKKNAKKKIAVAES